MIKLLASFLALALATSVMGQANDYEKIQANLADRMKGLLNVPTESSSLDASTSSSPNATSTLLPSTTASIVRVVSPVKLIRGRREAQNSYGSDGGSGQSNSIYLPGSGPSMPDASSTPPPQFGLGVTYSNLGTAIPTTSTANPAAAWYKNWLDSVPEPIKRLYGAASTTASPQGMVGRRRRSLSRLSRRSAEDGLASTTEGLDHHLKQASPAPEVENSTAYAINTPRVKRSAEEEEGLLHHHKHGHDDHEDASAPEIEVSTAQELNSTLRVKRSAEEEDVSTRAPCHHKHSSPITEESSISDVEGSTQGLDSILRSKRSISHIRDRIQDGIQNGIQNLFNGSSESAQSSTGEEIESESDPSSDVLGQGDGLAGGNGLLSQLASEDSTDSAVQVIYMNNSSPQVLNYTLSPSELFNVTESAASPNSTSIP